MGEAPAPLGWSLQLHTKLLESKTLVTMTKQTRYRNVTKPQASRGHQEKIGICRNPCCTSTPAQILSDAGALGGSCSNSIPGMLLHAQTAPKISKLFVRDGPEQGVGVEEETGRKDERANKSYQLKSKQATEMIPLKLFTPG